VISDLITVYSLKPTKQTMRYFSLLLFLTVTSLSAQEPPYDVFPEAEPPYFRVRYEASDKPGELAFPVKYTLWIPENVERLKGVIVHQHGCGEGSCKSGLTGAFDLHWQALAKKHHCALMAPSYEQPQDADCQLWCDPRNGSGDAFIKSLSDLGKMSGHLELSELPWALWGHSGGGHWAGGMTLLHPERVAAAWLRSGVPLLQTNESRPSIKTHTISDAVLGVPMMCNPGTKEGFTVKDGRFAGVWPANAAFFTAMREKGSLLGVAIDPLTAHECGNQRYLAIPWLDHCLSARLPSEKGKPLNPMATGDHWLAPLTGKTAVPASEYTDDKKTAMWLPNESLAKAWMAYVKDTQIPDTTPPPSPTYIRSNDGEITWRAEADLESGISHFIIERDGEVIGETGIEKNSFGRRISQGLQYSDTPAQPLVEMRYTDADAVDGKSHQYQVIAVNTVGMKSASSAHNWATLFDGKTLNGWESTSKANWRVEDGAIVVDHGEKGFLLHEDSYENFELQIEFKAAEGTNSGVFLNTKLKPEDLTRDCYELNIAPVDNPFPTGSLVARSKFEGAGETNEWRYFDIRVENGRVTVQLDGKEASNYQSDSPSEGNRIGLQLNSGRVAFRNVRARKL
jgi:pimeloyl-ACP methyl ester carboxylesterase